MSRLNSLAESMLTVSLLPILIVLYIVDNNFTCSDLLIEAFVRDRGATFQLGGARKFLNWATKKILLIIVL